ncbi:hypothetical protein Tco_0684585 [Tanacetum coccineum]
MQDRDESVLADMQCPLNGSTPIKGVYKMLDVNDVHWSPNFARLLLQTTHVEIIMVNIIPPDHVDDVPVVEPNQHDDVLVVPEPVLEDEDEDPEEE